MSRVVECSNIFAVSCYRADATNTNGRAFYSNASCYRADARNTIWRGSYHAWSQKYSSIATIWLCRWTRCCYRAHWHGMVVYNWWCDVDFHFWTLCKLLCCNVDGWNMQTYLYYLDEEATAISIRSVDESEMLAWWTRVRECEAVQSTKKWKCCDSRYLSAFMWNRMAHQINNNSRVLRTLYVHEDHWALLQSMSMQSVSITTEYAL